MLCAAQEQAIRVNYVKHKIDKTAESPLCRMCDKKSEAISHILSECEKLQEQFIGNCVKNKTSKEVKNGMNMLQKVLLKLRKLRFCGMLVKILWDVMIQCDREIKARKPEPGLGEREKNR